MNWMNEWIRWMMYWFHVSYNMRKDSKIVTKSWNLRSDLWPSSGENGEGRERAYSTTVKLPLWSELDEWFSTITIFSRKPWTSVELNEWMKEWNKWNNQMNDGFKPSLVTTPTTTTTTTFSRKASTKAGFDNPLASGLKRTIARRHPNSVLEWGEERRGRWGKLMVSDILSLLYTCSCTFRYPRPISLSDITNTPSDHILSRHVSLCSSTHLSIFMSFIFPTNSVRTRSKINANPAFAAFCLKWEEIKQSIKSCLISSARSIALFSGSLFRSRFLWFNSFSDKRRPADEETLSSAIDLWMKRP